jgi:hypothetical protein
MPSSARLGSVPELKAAIETWLTERNAKPNPFKWTAKANIILENNAVSGAHWNNTSRRVLNERVRTLGSVS